MCSNDTKLAKHDAAHVGKDGRRFLIDAQHSDARFSVKKFGFMYTVKGNFNDAMEGSILLHNDRLDAHGAVKVASLTTGQRGRGKHIITVRKRDAHLKTVDFFDSSHHPDVTLAAEDIPVTDAETDANVQVTIRGITHTIPVTVKALSRDDDHLLLVLNGQLDRHDFGLTPSKFFYDRLMVATHVRFQITAAATATS